MENKNVTFVVIGDLGIGSEPFLDILYAGTNPSMAENFTEFLEYSESTDLRMEVWRNNSHTQTCNAVYVNNKLTWQTEWDRTDELKKKVKTLEQELQDIYDEIAIIEGE